MDKILEQTLLYDFYGELLTDHQKQIYEDVVLNDYSFSEVAEEKGISRQGVHDLIKRCNKILQEYESKLHLVDRRDGKVLKGDRRAGQGSACAAVKRDIGEFIDGI